MQKQEMLPGTETPLSQAADEFVEAHDNLVRAKERKECAEAKLLDEMQEKGMSIINHGGYTLVLKPGRKTADKIKVE